MSPKKKANGNVWKLGITMLTNDSSFGLGVSVIFILWVGLSLSQMSIIISAWLIFHSIGQIPSGIFADSYGYKKSLLFGNIISFVGILIFASGFNFYSLLVGYSLMGFGAAMQQGADLALLYEHLKSEGNEEAYKKMVGRLDFYTNIFWVITGVLGGLLYTYHARAPFYAEAVVALVGIIACLQLVEPPRTIKHFPVLQQIKESIHYTFNTPKFSKIFLFSALIGSVAMITFQFLQPLYKTLGIPEAYFGFIAAAFFIFRGMGSWYADKLGKIFSVDKYLVLHAAVFGLFLVLMQHISSIYYIFPVLAVFYFLRGLYAPTVSTYINERVSSDKRATMLSINKQLLTVVAAVSVSGLGIIAEQFGLQQVFFAISVLSMLFLIAYVLSLRRVQMD
jgi:MFS family permease